MTSFDVAPITEATVSTTKEMLRPNEDQLPKGQEGPSAHAKVTHHLRMMGCRTSEKTLRDGRPEHPVRDMGIPTWEESSRTS